jgi:hypothetical protein
MITTPLVGKAFQLKQLKNDTFFGSSFLFLRFGYFTDNFIVAISAKVIILWILVDV